MFQVELPISYSFDIQIEHSHSPPVVTSDHTLSELITGEDRCLKFINQDLTFLQPSNIPSTFSNVVHNVISSVRVSQSQSQVKSSVVKLPTNTSKDQNSTPPTQTVQPVVGFMPAEIRRAEDKPKLTIE